MSNTEVPIKLVSMIVIGFLFIGIGVQVIRLYRSHFRDDRNKSMSWDVFATLLTGNFSFPIALAVMIITLGVLSSFIGGALNGSMQR